jgi:CheY-like chemotaxis protein
MKRRILVVGYREIPVEIHAILIAHNEDFEIVPTAGGLDSLEKVTEENVDLIITGLWMVPVSGLTLSRIVRNSSSLSGIPIIVATIFPLDAKEKETILEEANVLVESFVPEEALIRKIHELLPEQHAA